MARNTETFDLLLRAQDKLSPAAAKARESIKRLKASADTLEGRFEGPAKSASKLRNSLAKLSAQSERAARAQRDLQNGGGSSRSLLVEVRAREAVTKALEKQAVAQRKIELLRRQGFNASAETAQLAASKRLTSQLERQAVAQREVELRRARGLAVDRALADRAGVALNQTDAAAVAAQKVAAVKQRQLVAQQEILARQKAGLAVTKRLRSQAEGFEGALKRSSRTGNSLFFTFRRLVGVLAGFTIAREFVGGIKSSIVDTAKLAAQVEIAGLSFQTLLTATGETRNVLGESVPLAQQFALNLKLGQRQLKAIREDSLNTLATFQQLTDTNQVALAPGRAAGGSIDEIQEFATRISQAATALGVAQNQLSEEIRSLLAGNISKRNTRIATALGITNEDVKRAREAGNLFAFLSDRFKAFELSGQAAQNTLQGVGLRLRGLVEVSTLQASGGFIEELRTQAKALLETVLGIADEQGNLRPNPRFVRFLETVFSQIESLTQATGEWLRSLDLDQAASRVDQIGSALRKFLDIVGTAISTTASVLSGIVTAGNTIASVFGEAGSVIRKVLGNLLAIRLLFGAGVLSNFLGFNKALGAGVALSGSFSSKIRGLARSLAVAAVRAAATGLAIAGVVSTFNALGQIQSVDQGIRSRLDSIADEAVKVAEAIKASSSTDGFEEQLTRLKELKQEYQDVRAELVKLSNKEQEFRDKSVGSALAGVARDLVGLGTGEDLDASLRLTAETLGRQTAPIQELQRAQEALRSATEATTDTYLLFQNTLQTPTTRFKAQLDEATTRIQDIGSESDIARKKAQLLFDQGLNLTNEDVRARINISSAITNAQTQITEIEDAIRKAEASLGRVGLLRLNALRKQASIIENTASTEDERNAAIEASRGLTDRAQRGGGSEAVEQLAKVFNLTSELKTLKEELVELDKVQLKLQEEQTQGAIDELNARAQGELVALRAQVGVANADAALQRAQALVLTRADELGILQAQSDLVDTQVNQIQTEIQERTRLGRLERTLNGEQISAAQEKLQLENALAAAEIASLNAQKQAIELEKRRAQEGGFTRGARSFVESAGGIDAGDRFTQSQEELAGTAGSLLAQGFSESLLQSLSGGDISAVWDSIMVQGVSAIADELGELAVSGLFENLLPDLVDTGTDTAAGAALTGSASALTGAAAALTGAAAALAGGEAVSAGTNVISSFGVSGGFHSGGAIGGPANFNPPPGIHRNDNILIAAEKGEHVMPVPSVRSYGRDFMNMVQTGAIDPDIARALVKDNGKAPGRRPARRSPGRNSGGSIGSRTRSAAPAAAQGGGPTRAFVVADSRAMDRLMAGGSDRQVLRMGHQPSKYRSVFGGR